MHTIHEMRLDFPAHITEDVRMEPIFIFGSSFSQIFYFPWKILISKEENRQMTRTECGVAKNASNLHSKWNEAGGSKTCSTSYWTDNVGLNYFSTEFHFTSLDFVLQSIYRVIKTSFIYQCRTLKILKQVWIWQIV